MINWNVTPYTSEEFWCLWLISLTKYFHASVTCLSFFFSAGLGSVEDTFGIGDGVFWLDDLGCHGNETHLAECWSSGWGTHNCQYFEAVGIACGEQQRTEVTSFKIFCLSTVVVSAHIK